MNRQRSIDLRCALILGLVFSLVAFGIVQGIGEALESASLVVGLR